MPAGWVLLAWQSRAARNSMSIAIAGGILLVLVLALGVVILWMRKKYVVGEADEPSEPLTLGDLREIQATGLISDKEFARLRDMIIAEARATAGLDADEKESEPPETSDNPLRPIEAHRDDPAQPSAEDGPESESDADGGEDERPPGR